MIPVGAFIIRLNDQFRNGDSMTPRPIKSNEVEESGRAQAAVVFGGMLAVQCYFYGHRCRAGKHNSRIHLDY